MVATSVAAPGMKASRSCTAARARTGSPSSIATRSRSAAAKSSSPFIARAVIAAILSFSPAWSASSSSVSPTTMVLSMSATSRRLRRPSAACATRSKGASPRAARAAASAASGAASANGMSAASPGLSQSGAPASADPAHRPADGIEHGAVEQPAPRRGDHGQHQVHPPTMAGRR